VLENYAGALDQAGQTHEAIAAFALFNAGKFQDAAASYRETVCLNPAFAHVHYNLGVVLLRLDDAKSAQAEFAEAHRLDPSLNPPK
jgi:tetratricopeptide (TPR) repeat protein